MQAEVVWHGGKWREYEQPVMRQSAPRVEKGELRAHVLATLADGQLRSISGLAEQMRRGYDAVRDLMPTLVAGGQVERVDMGRGGIRYRVIR